jgi:phosphoribosyl 1,2-cyclic phosphodiesterase
MLRFCSLGSGSAGNATLLEVTSGTTTTRLLMDCGLPYKQMDERLARRGLALTDIDAVFVTHEHSDHVGCARQLALQAKLPLLMSRGTYVAMGSPDLEGRVQFVLDGESIQLKDLSIKPFTVAHDAKEPLQLTVTDGDKRFGLLTDLGHVTPYVALQMQNLHAVVLEFNHDEAMLQASKYPPFLKQRISGNYGHLSNVQAADLLQSVAHKDLRHVVAAHLSEQNNHPDIVRQAMTACAGGFDFQVSLADAEAGFDWLVA